MEKQTASGPKRFVFVICPDPTQSVRVSQGFVKEGSSTGDAMADLLKSSLESDGHTVAFVGEFPSAGPYPCPAGWSSARTKAPEPLAPPFDPVRHKKETMPGRMAFNPRNPQDLG